MQGGKESGWWRSGWFQRTCSGYAAAKESYAVRLTNSTRAIVVVYTISWLEVSAGEV